MSSRQSDYTFHPPSPGSNVPGKVDANPYVQYPPQELRRMLEVENDPEERKKMISALKQWERIYVFPGYPHRRTAKKIAHRYLEKIAELPHPSINLPYYQDSETPQGLGEIVDSLGNLHDNEDNVRFDYKRHGERPLRDIDIAEGDFLSPKEPPMGDVCKEDGDGADPADMENPFPPTGGDMDALPL
jgi:hypothetical protein